MGAEPRLLPHFPVSNVIGSSRAAVFSEYLSRLRIELLTLLVLALRFRHLATDAILLLLISCRCQVCPKSRSHRASCRQQRSKTSSIAWPPCWSAWPWMWKRSEKCSSRVPVPDRLPCTASACGAAHRVPWGSGLTRRGRLCALLESKRAALLRWERSRTVKLRNVKSGNCF